MSKQTKKGCVPVLRFPEFREAGEWEATLLIEVASVIMGSSPSSSVYNEKGEGKLLIQGNADIKNRLSAPRIFTTQITKECLVGDILLSVRAPVGTVAKSNHHACIGRGIAAIHANKYNSQEYLYQWLISFESKWNNISQGGTFDAVNSEDIKFLKLAIPSLDEQQKIAACLSSLDELITAQAQKLEALKTHKKGLMRQLFPAMGETAPKLRFPEFREAGEWENKKFGEMCKFVRGPFGGALKKDIFVKDGYAVYEQSHAIYQNFDSFRYFITEEKYNELKRFSVHPNDIIMSCSGTMGKFAVIPKELKKGVINQALLKLTVNNGYNLDFVKFTLELPVNQEKLLSQSAGGAIKNVVGVGDMKEIEMSIPSFNEQQKIAACLSSLDELIAAQAQKLEALKTHKKGLMQQLFPAVDEVAG